jgi:peptidoglycan/LPS O-acetylase OafA/YrhL
VTAFVFTPLLYFRSETQIGFFSIRPSAIGYIAHNLFQPRAQIAIGSIPDNVPWPHDWNGSLWTLFYEGACYLFVAAFGVVGLLRRFRRLGGALLIGCLILFGIHEAIGAGRLPSFIGRLFDTPGKRLTMYFISGMLFVVFPVFRTWLRVHKWIGPAAAFTWITCLGLGWGGVAGPFCLSIALFWLADTLPFARYEKAVGGDYSYGLYVYAYPVQQILSHLLVYRFGFLAYFSASVLATIPFAVLSWHLVEKKAMRLKSWQPNFEWLPR